MNLRLNRCWALLLATSLTYSAAVIANDKCAAAATRPAGATVDPKVLALAKEWFHRFQTGNIDRSQLDASSNMELTAQDIREQEAALSALGKPAGFKFLGSDSIQGDRAYHFLITFAGPDRIVESIALNKWGKIAGIDFATYAPSPM